MRSRHHRARWGAVGLCAVLTVGSLPEFQSRAFAQSSTYQMVRTDNRLRDGDFYLLSLLATAPGVRQALGEDPALRRLKDASIARRQAALNTCSKAMTCRADDLRMLPDEISAAESALADLVRKGGPLARLVTHDLRPSGAFQKFAQLDDASLMAAAWREAASGLNRLYDVYGAGTPPRYASTDSMIWAPDSLGFSAKVKTSIDITRDLPDDHPFFAIWSEVGLDLLMLNQRDDVVRNQSLEEVENSAALRRARNLSWKDYRYTAIIVPGFGTEEGERGLSGVGELRIRLAARRFREGLAPFILVSGGNVHPNRTPYNEAAEMKRGLMQRYNIPESAILIDPSARHTTTNLRNAARLLFRAGAPLSSPALITTSSDQSKIIDSAIFTSRCGTELGYIPFNTASRSGPFDLAVTLNVLSLHRDPSDPLDP